MATQGPIHNPETVVDPMIDPRTGEYVVIAPGHNFRSVTQKIAGIVLTANTPLGVGRRPELPGGHGSHVQPDRDYLAGAQGRRASGV